MKHVCRISPTCLQYPLIKLSGRKSVVEGEKKKQSIKPSNDKYGIGVEREYYFPSLRMLGRLLGWSGEAYLYVNGRLIIFICKERGNEQISHTHAHTLTQKWESLVITQLYFCLTEERNNRKGRERGEERERDQSCGCQLQRGSPLQNILITSPAHYWCHVNERERWNFKQRGPVL